MDFDIIAKIMTRAMEQHARKLGVSGVIVVTHLAPDGMSWKSVMKAVEKIKVTADNKEKNPKYPGYNFIGIAYSKAAEMADTLQNSGTKTRPSYQGEFGYGGGLIAQSQAGSILSVFSGSTEELDTEIAQIGIDAFFASGNFFISSK